MANKFIKFLEAIMTPDDTSEEGVYVKRILTDYRNKRHLYEEFCAAVFKLLDAVLKENHYKYQIISRTKSPERLRDKLIRKNSEGKRYKNLNEIEDLAGVRVLFYSEADKDRFVAQLKKEMGGTMYIQERKRRTGYEATHIILSFGQKRLELSEYKHFKGLKTEVQITSILRHTWAEIEHDFIYKDISGLKKRDPEKYALVKQRLAEILDNHIKQAGDEFEELIKMIDQK